MALTQLQIDSYKQEYNIPVDSEIRVFRIVPKEGKPVNEYDPIKYFAGYNQFAAKAIPGQYVEAIVGCTDISTLEIVDPENELEEVL